MSSSPVAEPSSPSTPPLHASTPIYTGKRQPPLSVELVPTPLTPPINDVVFPIIPGEPTLTPPPLSPSPLAPSSPAGDAPRAHTAIPSQTTQTKPAPDTPQAHVSHQPDGTSSDKSSETAVVKQPSASQLSRKESYKAQRQHYRREKKRAASALLHSIHDPSVVVLADWLKVRGSLKSWTKLWCVLKPGLLLLYKSPKAKSSHWVGTVLLTSCQVIERPSKKDGFCFKLYHPLEQSIWAPRGPHNETIGAVVQPLPTAHLIFRAPSQAAGHCWLDGLELALRCSNAMLRCEQPRTEAAADVSQPSLSHEELEKHFNEHDSRNPSLSFCHTPLLSVSEYTSNYLYQNQVQKPKIKKPSKWTQFVESIEMLSKDNTSDSENPEKDGKEHGILDFLRKKEMFDRDTVATSSMRYLRPRKTEEVKSKSVNTSPLKNEGSLIKKVPIFRCFDVPKLQLPLLEKTHEKLNKFSSPTNIIEDNFLKIVTNMPRRSSTPSVIKNLAKTRRQNLRMSGAKTDSENEDNKMDFGKKRKRDVSPRVKITKTAPSMEGFGKYTSSSSDENERIGESTYRRLDPRSPTPDKYSLIDYSRMPSVKYAAVNQRRMGDRVYSQNIYVAGQIVQCGYELAGAASESDSSDSHGMAADAPVRRQDILARLLREWTEDTDREIGAAGELVEEVAEENKSLLWFLLKQVRPGMDLSKVVLPTFILEPRSFLDKLSDNYYHADILAQAQTLEDPYQRFKCVLRWYLSGLYKKPKGLKKPYNPVLGETFRCCWRHPGDTTTYYVAEQVSHHPPVSAFYVSNRKEGFVIQGSLLARSKFYGNSTSAILEGCARVHLLTWGETYLTTAPYAHCKGIVIGTLSMELGGKVHVICNETGYQADVEFKLRSFLGSAESTNAISGRIKKGKDVVASIDGYWDGRIDIKDKKTGEESVLLDCAILKQQRLPRYLMKLEHQQPHESQRLWVKVSQAIANDDQVAATEQKTIIEEAQRARAKNVNAPPWVARIFSKDVLGAAPPEGIVDQAWRYNHANTTRWQDDEVMEYEEDFVIQSLTSAGLAVAPRTSRAQSAPRLPEQRERDLSVMLGRVSDSESHDDTHRPSNTSARTLKQTLYSMDTSLRDQAAAIERLSKAVENINETQRASVRPINLGRIPSSSHIWDLFGGFVLAIVLQALLKWIFYHKQ